MATTCLVHRDYRKMVTFALTLPRGNS
ncbi:hypothetical protein AERO9AM_20031 [Aeromicrobium sp. 9AM]|nr:hypothetical protein AERO9AM_20031 [Aeromicrobium sp. 9AM]